MIVERSIFPKRGRSDRIFVQDNVISLGARNCLSIGRSAEPICCYGGNDEGNKEFFAENGWHRFLTRHHVILPSTWLRQIDESSNRLGSIRPHRNLDLPYAHSPWDVKLQLKMALQFRQWGKCKACGAGDRDLLRGIWWRELRGQLQDPCRRRSEMRTPLAGGAGRPKQCRVKRESSLGRVTGAVPG